MTDINILTKLMNRLYGAEVLPDEESKRWLDDGEELVIGYCFPDPQKSYYLLSGNDIRLLTAEQQETYISHLKYPFPDPKVVVFRDEHGDVFFRMTGGVGRSMFNLFDAWQHWDD